MSLNGQAETEVILKLFVYIPRCISETQMDTGIEKTSSCVRAFDREVHVPCLLGPSQSHLASHPFASADHKSLVQTRTVTTAITVIEEILEA